MIDISYPSKIKSLFVLKPQVYADDRGYFLETFRLTNFKNLPPFVQENESFNENKYTLRGLHFQTGKHAQSKLVRVVKGSAYDIAVDLRSNSPTFGQWYGLELNEKNKFQLYIPRGFAHGFLTLENKTIFQYKCDNYFDSASDSGIYFNSKLLNIKWPQTENEYILSNKDKLLEEFSPNKKYF